MLSALGFSLLRRLADGKIHSGEALAAGSGISRARVSQLLKEADAAGLNLERAPGRGYRLHDAVPFLERSAILAALGERAQALTIEVADCLDSTSSELARRAASEDIHRHLLVTEWQTAGRGRRGRGWTAVLGGSLTFSLGWRFSQGGGHLSALPLAVGLALARALEGAGFTGVELKWPNDLICGDAKVGGILVEVSGDALGPSLAILGVGLNIHLPATCKRDIGRPVADLATIGGKQAIDRNALLACFVAELVAMLEGYADAGFAPLRSAWQRRHAYQEKQVLILLPDGAKVRGRVVGVNAAGALILDSGGHRRHFVSGEVSLRQP